MPTLKRRLKRENVIALESLVHDPVGAGGEGKQRWRAVSGGDERNSQMQGGVLIPVVWVTSVRRAGSGGGREACQRL